MRQMSILVVENMSDSMKKRVSDVEAACNELQIAAGQYHIHKAVNRKETEQIRDMLHDNDIPSLMIFDLHITGQPAEDIDSVVQSILDSTDPYFTHRPIIIISSAKDSELARRIKKERSKRFVYYIDRLENTGVAKREEIRQLILEGMKLVKADASR